MYQFLQVLTQYDYCECGGSLGAPWYKGGCVRRTCNECKSDVVFDSIATPHTIQEERLSDC